MINQIIIILSILSFITIGYLVKKQENQSISDFTISRNRLKWFPISAGISMTFTGGAALINMPSLGYTFSWYNLVDPIAVISGLLIVIFFIKQYREDNGVTISDLLSKVDRKLSILIGIITTVVFLLFIAAQFVALSKLLMPYFPSVNPIILTIIPSTLIFSYVFLGGFVSVTRTDIMQFFFIAFLFIIPVAYFFLFKEAHILKTNHTQPTFQAMPMNLIILLAFPLLYIPFSQDINIRAKSAVTKRQATLGVIWGGIFYSLIIISSTYIGITLAKNGIILDDTEKAFSTFFKEYYPHIGIIAIIATLAAIVSSLDSYSLNAISSMSNDILLKLNPFKEKKQKVFIKISAILVFILSLGIALFFNKVLTLILTALLIYISTLVPIAFGRKFKLPDSYIFTSSVLLIISIIVIELFKVELSPKAIIYPGLGVLFMISFLIIKRVKNN
ncbi:MAG: hypothetical protein KAT68_19170 [Bacteroidales bacterium]|nr:hypothetical protein [Bacteroidales bacterium]